MNPGHGIGVEMMEKILSGLLEGGRAVSIGSWLKIPDTGSLTNLSQY